MSKLTKTQIRKMIIKELTKMVDEDALLPKRTYPENPDNAQDQQYMVICNECGGTMYEGHCSECGATDGGMLEEGDCGCGTCDKCNDGNEDYSISTMHGMHVDLPGHTEENKKHNNYMAKPQLYKISQYAQKLLQMIPDGYELADWQRSHLASIADDMSEVYHSLEFDFYDEE